MIFVQYILGLMYRFYIKNKIVGTHLLTPK